MGSEEMEDAGGAFLVTGGGLGVSRRVGVAGWLQLGSSLRLRWAHEDKRGLINARTHSEERFEFFHKD